MTAETVYFVHISDTHFGPTAGFASRGHQPLSCARRLVEVINTLPQRPDFVIHTGDVTNEPGYSAYRLAAETFARLEVPIYYVAGNHDTPAGIRRHLEMGPVEDVDPHPDRLSYTFEVKGYRFLILDARGPAEIEPRGLLPDSQLDVVAREAGPEGPPLTIFIHYPVLAMNSIWMDANMLVENGNALHRMLAACGDRLRGVFFGHIHQHMQIMRDGILYASAASAFTQFAAWPDDADVRFDDQEPPGYSFVHLLADQTIVHIHTFPRPETDGI